MQLLLVSFLAHHIQENYISFAPLWKKNQHLKYDAKYAYVSFVVLEHRVKTKTGRYKEFTRSRVRPLLLHHRVRSA